LARHSDGWLVLAGRERLLDEVEERRRCTRELLDAHGGSLARLAALPFVRSLALSGGAAHENLGAHADIDLFVVAASGHAYLVYTLLVLATRLSGKRRLICPNYIVDEDERAIAYHHDLF